MKHQWHQQALSASNYVALCALGSFVSASVRLSVLSSTPCERVVNVLHRDRESERERGGGGKRGERDLYSLYPTPPTHARSRARTHSVTDSACRTIIAIMPTQFTIRINTPRRRRRYRSVPLCRSNGSVCEWHTMLKANLYGLFSVLVVPDKSAPERVMCEQCFRQKWLCPLTKLVDYLINVAWDFQSVPAVWSVTLANSRETSSKATFSCESREIFRTHVERAKKLSSRVAGPFFISEDTLFQTNFVF